MRHPDIEVYAPRGKVKEVALDPALVKAWFSISGHFYYRTLKLSVH